MRLMCNVQRIDGDGCGNDSRSEILAMSTARKRMFTVKYNGSKIGSFGEMISRIFFARDTHHGPRCAGSSYCVDRSGPDLPCMQGEAC